MIAWYGLDGKPMQMEEAGRLLSDELARRVAHTKLVTGRGTVAVSTVFLVLDHSHTGAGPPVLWETMVFGGPADKHIWRYTSREAAEAGHAEAVTWAWTALNVEGVPVIATETLYGAKASRL